MDATADAHSTGAYLYLGAHGQLAGQADSRWSTQRWWAHFRLRADQSNRVDVRTLAGRGAFFKTRPDLDYDRFSPFCARAPGSHPRARYVISEAAHTHT